MPDFIVASTIIVVLLALFLALGVISSKGTSAIAPGGAWPRPAPATGKFWIEARATHGSDRFSFGPVPTRTEAVSSMLRLACERKEFAKWQVSEEQQPESAPVAALERAV